MSELSIKVTIAGRIYPITAKADEEEAVRAAADEVNTNIKFLQDNYAVKDKQDLLAMTALQLSTKFMDMQLKAKTSIEMSQLDEIEKLIDAML